MVKATRGFGLAGESPTDTIYIAAVAAEQAGYGSFWLSQPRHGLTLVDLGSVARKTQTIRVGVGAIPLTAQSPGEIESLVRELAIPLDRLRLGIGSGMGTGSLDRLRAGVETLRSLIDVEIVVAPLGPKMCRLAGEIADAVLLNWLTPAHASTSLSWIRDGALSRERDMPVTATYVRCALGADARSRLEMECARYGSFPHYAAHFSRQGVQPIQTTIHANSDWELQERIAAYESVLDEVIVRAITSSDTSSEILALVESAKPEN